MLTITIPLSNEQWDEEKEEFIAGKDVTLKLEHSLVSISKWEAKWKIPFLKKTEPKTIEQTIDYIKCMTLTQNVDPNVYNYITNDIIQQVNNYIEDPMTATTITRVQNGPPNREILTSELIYYYMIAQQIPIECQKWHLNRLIMLIEICSIKNTPDKKMTQGETMARHRAVNAARRRR